MDFRIIKKVLFEKVLQAIVASETIVPNQTRKEWNFEYTKSSILIDFRVNENCLE